MMVFFIYSKIVQKHENKPPFDDTPRPNVAQKDVLSLIFWHLNNEVHFFLFVARRYTQRCIVSIIVLRAYILAFGENINEAKLIQILPIFICFIIYGVKW